VRVALLAPEWDRLCAVCEKYVYREDNTLALRRGLVVLRPEGTPTPCHKCAKVPLSVRASGADWKECRAQAVEATDQSRKAWAFYQRCKAVNRFPDDPLVSWSAAVIAEVERTAAQMPFAKLSAGIEVLTLLLQKRGR
jgi:hypothetical protein